MKDAQAILDIQHALEPVSVPESACKEALSRDEVNRRSEADWREILGDTRYRVLKEADTEQAFNSELLNEQRAGTFVTADCGEPVFRSEHKFDSGSGWPSFWRPVSPDAVTLKTDESLGMSRIEVTSAVCGSHLGHVFTDGPHTAADGAPATGLRYCINGAALRFIPDAE